MTDPLPILIAFGWDDLLKFLLPFALLLIWVISQISEAKKQAGPPKGKPIAPGPKPEEAAERPRRPEARPARPADDPLRDQVDEFLRRAGREPKAEQPAAVRGKRRPPPAADEIEILLGDETSTTHSKTLAEPLRPIEPEMTAPKGPRAAKKPRAPRREQRPHRESIAEHAEQIRSHARALEDRSSRLGQRILNEDAQFDVQLKARFDHTLGSLAGHSTPPAESLAQSPGDTPAAQIAAMLSNPDGARQAIVLNEILRRPDDWW